MSWTVVLAEDRGRTRELLAAIIDSNPAFQVVGLASDGAEAADVCERTTPDLVLMDVVMRPVDGIEGTRRVMQRLPGTKVVALTSFAHPDWLVRMLRAGACGYLAKESTPAELFDALRSVLERQGAYALSPGVVNALGRHLVTSNLGERPLVGGSVDGGLTERELELVGWLAQGLSNRLIAKAMTITENSVKIALGRVMAKLACAIEYRS
ncbi:response regulator transcription factor [Micropruina sp.]|uniref:response regulator transcription factor n=1 Tax=Micropruina sp. TaxID=2737536 RepID=UPI0039E41B0B